MEIKTLIEIVVVLVGGIGSFFILKNTVENLKDENQKQWTVITDLREWQDTHQRNSSDTRLEIEKDMGKLRENTGKIEGQLFEMVRLIKKLDERLEKWIEKHDK